MDRFALSKRRGALLNRGGEKYFKSSRKILVGIVASVLIIAAIFSSSLFPSPFDQEIRFYREKSGYTIDDSQSWDVFKELKGIFTEVRRVDLRVEAEKVEKELGFVRVYIDRLEKIIWISGLGPKEDVRYIYWWRAP